MDWLVTFEIIIKCGEDLYRGEDSGFYYERDYSGYWWVDACGKEFGPFNTLEHAAECAAEQFGW